MQTFYNDLGSITRIMIDVVVRGTLMGKAPKATYELLGEMVSNNYQWFSERIIPRRAVGVYNVDIVTVSCAKIIVIHNKLDNLNI